MGVSFGARFKNAWNALINGNDESRYKYTGSSYSLRPDRPRFTRGNEKTIVTAIYNRIAMDCATIDVKHVRLDDYGRYSSEMPTSLNECLTLSANKDQSARAFIQDIVMSMLDEGSVAVVPVDTSNDPRFTDSYDIFSLRTAKIVEWFPDYVKVKMYNDRTGNKEEVKLPKSMVAIIENPLFAVVNETNSVLQRLIHKLSLLDYTDEQTSSGKLDLIIQLPYVVKTEQRKKQAEERRKDIAQQLEGSKYGIAYTDGTEKVTQLNRSIENNLMSQIEYLTSMLMSQLGVTQEILNGTANDVAMLNYNSRTVEPIMAAIVDEFNRKFISRTARTQKQAIVYFKEPFKLVSVNTLAEIADKFTRNEILTANEIRQIIGYKPSDDPNADVLRNKNLNAQEGQVEEPVYSDEEDPSYYTEGEEEIQNG